MTRNNLNPLISEEAAEWLVEFRTGEVESAKLQRFDTWVRTSPEHLRAYLEMAAIWNEGSALDARHQLSPLQLLAAIQSEANVVPMVAPARAMSTLRGPAVERPMHDMPRIVCRKFLAAAAVAGLLLATGLVTILTLWRAPVYVTEAGEQRSLALTDGSVVTLNSRSRIRVRMSEHERRLDLLEGQALFKVAKDPQRPFIVGSDNVRVRAVGTEFDVYRRINGTVVTVIEGRVIVSGASSPASTVGTRHVSEVAAGSTMHPAAGAPLAAGQQLTVTDAGPGRAAPAELPVVTAWTQRQLIFQSATLAEVAEEFNRYSSRKFVIEEHATRSLRVSGVFSIDPRFMLGYLRSRPNLKVIEHGDEIRIVHDDG